MPRFCFVLLLCLWSALAIAGPKEDASAKKKSGDKLMAQGDFNDALKAYEEAIAIFADPEFDLARGDALLKLRRYDEAKTAYQKYLDTSKNNKSKNDVKKAIADIERILKTSLSCQSEPAGATVFLNSRVDGEVGPTPITFNLPPGTHRIIFVKDGFRSKTETVTVNEGETQTVSTKLEVAPYTVDVSTTPGNASIWVDGTEKGKSPSVVELSEGSHTVELKLEGHQTLSKKLEGKAGEKQTLAHTFVENPSQLLIVAEPAVQGVVEITGKEARGTIGTPLDLPPGKYNVVIKSNGFKDVATVVDIERAKTTETRVTLEPYPIRFSVKSNLPTFTLLVDGQPQTLSGGSIEVVPGKHKVEVTAPKQTPYKSDINFNPGEELNLDVNFKLEKRVGTKRIFFATAGTAAIASIAGLIALDAGFDVQEARNDPEADIDTLITKANRRAFTCDFLFATAISGSIWWYVRHQKEGPSTSSINKKPSPPQGNP